MQYISGWISLLLCCGEHQRFPILVKERPISSAVPAGLDVLLNLTGVANRSASPQTKAIFNPTRHRNTAKARFNWDTFNLYASLTPTGANNMVIGTRTAKTTQLT